MRVPFDPSSGLYQTLLPAHRLGLPQGFGMAVRQLRGSFGMLHPPHPAAERSLDLDLQAAERGCLASAERAALRLDLPPAAEVVPVLEGQAASAGTTLEDGWRAALTEGVLLVSQQFERPLPVYLDGAPVVKRHIQVRAVPGMLPSQQFYRWLLPELVRAAEDQLLGRRYLPAIRFSTGASAGQVGFEGRDGPRPATACSGARTGGRRRGVRVVSVPEIQQAVSVVRRSQRPTAAVIARSLAVSRATLYRVLHDSGAHLSDLAPS